MIEPTPQDLKRESYFMDLFGNLNNHPDPDKVIEEILGSILMPDVLERLVIQIIHWNNMEVPLGESEIATLVSALYRDICEKEVASKYP